MTTRGPTLGEVAVGVVSDATGFDQGLAQAIDQSLGAPLAAAQAAAAGTVAEIDKLEGVKGPDLSRSVKDTASLTTGINTAARAIDQLDLGVEGLGQTVAQVSQGISAGGLLGLATGVVAVVGFAIAQVGRMERQIRQRAGEIAETISGTNATFAELEQNLDKAFTVGQQAQLVAWGFNLRDVATDVKVFSEALLAIQAAQPDGGFLGGIAEDLAGAQIDATLEALQEQWRLTAEEARWSAEQQRIAAESLPARIEAAGERITTEWERINAEGEALRSGLETSFAGWVDVISGVPDQLAVTADEIAANAANIQVAAAQQMLSWVEAVEAGAPNVAQAILDAGPEANAAFAELLDNPELLRATEDALANTADLTKQLIDEQVSGLVDPQLEALFVEQFAGLGVQGMIGLGRGLASEAPAVAADLFRLMNSLVTTAYEAWAAKSPSKKFADLGEEGLRGLEQGLGQSDRTKSALRQELEAIVNSAVPVARRGGRTVAVAITDSLAAELEAWGDQLRLVEVTRALEQAREEVTQLGEAWTASEIVAVERAEEHLQQLLDTRRQVAAAEQDMAAAQTALAVAEQARREAAEAWDFAGFQAAERARDEASKQLEAARRVLDSRVASDAEIALAQQQVDEARESPEQARFDAALSLERASLQAIQAQVAQGADIASLLHQVASRPTTFTVDLHFESAVSPEEARRIGEEVVAGAIKQLVDAMADR